MIHIAVITRQGAPAGQPIAADFGPNGGTIGRADTNTLVLVDPDRTVSRVHAQVLCRDGQYFVIDRGSNPMQCNGMSLGSGKEAPLADGTRLVVGSFELSVRLSATAPPALAIPNTVMSAPAAAAPASAGDDPFADLLAGLAPPAAPAAAPAAASHANAAPPASADSLLFPDPMETGSRNAQAAQEGGEQFVVGRRALGAGRGCSLDWRRWRRQRLHRLARDLGPADAYRLPRDVVELRQRFHGRRGRRRRRWRDGSRRREAELLDRHMVGARRRRGRCRTLQCGQRVRGRSRVGLQQRICLLYTSPSPRDS